LSWGEREGAEWVVREGVGAEMTQALYAHMNNKRKMKKKKKIQTIVNLTMGPCPHKPIES
jgi:hypothetical protein